MLRIEPITHLSISTICVGFRNISKEKLNYGLGIGYGFLCSVRMIMIMYFMKTSRYGTRLDQLNHYVTKISCYQIDWSVEPLICVRTNVVDTDQRSAVDYIYTLSLLYTLSLSLSLSLL
jgi:hypothetical protein